MTGPTTLAATVAAFTAAVAVAVAAPTATTTPASPPRIAVLADSGASQADIAQALASARVVAPQVEVLRTGPEARAQAARLAAEGYAVVAAAGPQARAAVSEARAAGISPATRFVTR